MEHDHGQQIAEQVLRIVRARAIAAVAEHDIALSRVYDRIAEGIRADLKATGYSISDVRDVLDKHIAGTAEERRSIIADAIKRSALEARGMDEATFNAVFGGEAATEAARPFAPSSPPTGKLLLLRRKESAAKP